MTLGKMTISMMLRIMSLSKSILCCFNKRHDQCHIYIVILNVMVASLVLAE